LSAIRLRKEAHQDSLKTLEEASNRFTGSLSELIASLTATNEKLQRRIDFGIPSEPMPEYE